MYGMINSFHVWPGFSEVVGAAVWTGLDHQHGRTPRRDQGATRAERQRECSEGPRACHVRLSTNLHVGPGVTRHEQADPPARSRRDSTDSEQRWFCTATVVAAWLAVWRLSPR